jgi:hypothetical protein
MLGGVIGGRGDELSGSVGAGGSPPSGGFSLPDLSPDWNWSDLPVKLTASESVSYNSNIFAVPSGSNVLLNGQPHGDFTLDLVLWSINESQLVWPAVFLRRDVQAHTVSA